MERGAAIRDLLKQAATLVIFFLLMRVWWGDEQWFQDKVKELSFLIGMTAAFIIASLGVRLISRPVTIQVTQSNKQFNKDETNFSITGRKKTQEHERTVDLQLFVVKANSVWGKLVCSILKKHNIAILVEPVTKGIILEAENESLRYDVAATQSGFKIELNDYIESILTNSSPGQHNKGCAFVIQEDRNHRVSDEVIQITPMFTAKDKNAPLWITLLVKFNNVSHNVNFKWE